MKNLLSYSIMLILVTINNNILSGDEEELSVAAATISHEPELATQRGLMLAIKHKNHALVRQLLADTKSMSKMSKFLSKALRKETNPLVRDINNKMPINGSMMRPLELAARNADPEMVRILINHGADINKMLDRPIRSFTDLFGLVGEGEESDLTRSLLEEHWTEPKRSI